MHRRAVVLIRHFLNLRGLFLFFSLLFMHFHFSRKHARIFLRCRPATPVFVRGERQMVKYFHFIFFLYKTNLFLKILSVVINGVIKKTCAFCDVCGNSVGIPSNKMQE